MADAFDTIDGDAPWLTDPLYGGMSPGSAERSWRAAQERRSRVVDWLEARGDEPPPPAGSADYGIPEVSGKSNATPRFTPIAIDDVQITTNAAWLIRRLLPARGLACIIGPPKSGKSFMTSDMLFSVARGATYAGRDSMAGPVVYLTGEGVVGFRRRLVALRRHYQVEGQGVPFFLIENVPDLGSERTDVDQLLQELDLFILERDLGPPRAIVFDTLARCMGAGDENSARDMGRFVNRCGVIERHFGCLVVAVHHMGKNPAAGARGSNALNGAADVTITVEKGETYSTVRIEEMKDGPEGQEWRFRLVSTPLAETFGTPTETASETTTCIVELLADASQAKQRETKSVKVPGGVPGDLLKVVRRAIDEAGRRNVQSELVPHGIAAVDRATLRRFCKIMAWQDQDEKPDGFRSVLSRSLSTLRAAGLISFTEDWIWLT
jgi:hypothetical protein